MSSRRAARLNAMKMAALCLFVLVIHYRSPVDYDHAVGRRTLTKEVKHQLALDTQSLALIGNSTVQEKKVYCDRRTAVWDMQLTNNGPGSLSHQECLLMKIACGVPSCEASIDLVYLWVNGSDPVFLERKNRTIAAMEATGESKQYNEMAWKSGTAENRFRSMDELKYSFRSVEENAPWSRRIFLVTDDQIPSFINPDKSLRLRMVSHKDLFSYVNISQTRHVYNTKAIQAMVHAIPTLSSPFMLMDDDMLFGQQVPWSHLYNEKEQKYFMRLGNHEAGIPRVLFHMHFLSIWNSIDVFGSKYGNVTPASRLLNQTENEEPLLNPLEHGPKILYPQDGFQLWKDFRDTFEREVGFSFRNQNSINIPHLYALEGERQGRYKFEVSTRKGFGHFQLKNLSYNVTMDRLLNATDRPYFVCINDDFISTDPEFLGRAIAYVQKVLEKVFVEQVLS